jgi:hypothetical protein
MKKTILTCLAVLSIAAIPCLAKEKRFAPLRPQVLSAKTVFLAGGPPAVLDKAFGALKKWGRFQVVSDPALADVVFEFRYGMARAPQTASVSVYDPDAGNTTYGSATTPGVWSEFLTITDAKTKEVLYEDGRAISPGLVTLLSRYSMARDMLKDLQKRIDATESAQIWGYAIQFGARAAKYFMDAAALREKAAARGLFSDDPLKNKGMEWREFADQLSKWNLKTTESLADATSDDLAKKSNLEPIKKYRDDILSYTCAMIAGNQLVELDADKLRSNLPADFLQALDEERADAATLRADCSSEQAKDLLKTQAKQ